ncbi:hypothetical protein LIP_0522 [Limnochorda pilosa]|uniref:Uncharacterized protein n=2 Tax=Limnochorda pilosa TaxID=1555112 RepID=A0A0K2SHR4_LIMPI|nr:hypothetical protein LIP_0522 [Limnochorda pilosa]
MPVPPFVDGYHLPEGEHPCTLEEARERFAVGSSRREEIWRSFTGLLHRLEQIKLFPEVILLDGSFVTGKSDPGGR